MKKILQNSIKVIVIFAWLILSLSVNGQQKRNRKSDNRAFKDKVFVGGALGFGFGSNSTRVEVSPTFGYSVTNDFIVGLGLTYNYFRYNDYYYNLDSGELTDHKTNIYGASIWTRYFLTKIGIPIIENTFLHAEVEPLIFQNNFLVVPQSQGDYTNGYGNYFIKENNQVTLTGVFLGGGLKQMLGGRSYMYIEVLWNFNEELYSPYSNPRIRIGVAAGI